MSPNVGGALSSLAVLGQKVSRQLGIHEVAGRAAALELLSGAMRAAAVPVVARAADGRGAAEAAATGEG